MNPSERELRRKILILEEDLRAWLPWHCYDEYCPHHMCTVRTSKVRYLDSRIRSLYIKWRLIREAKRLLRV